MMMNCSGLGRPAMAGAAVILVLSACAVAPLRNDPVTSGMAEISIHPGTTTQQEVLEAFGAPNIVSRAAAGKESWTYERVSFDSAYRHGGVGILGGGAATDGVLGGSASARGGSTTSGTHTVTLIVYFDENEIVSDYRVMETHF